MSPTRIGQRRAVRFGFAALATVTAAGVVAALAVSPGGAAPRPSKAPITLTFAGEVIGESGLADFAGPYPPIEGGAALDYTVPDRYRLVIDALYANVSESWVPDVTYRRAFVTVGISSAYDLGEQCAYPGFERAYDVPLSTDVSQVYGSEEGQSQRGGSLSGPIVVEGGRHVNGTAWAPAGDSTVYVHVVAHGWLEPTDSNPSLPTCGP